MTLRKKPQIFIAVVFAILAASCSSASTPDQNGSGEKNGPGADVYDLFAEIESSGATVENAEALSQPFLSVEGQIVKINGVEIQVFEFTDAVAALAESEMFSSDGSSTSTTMITWIDVPHLYLKERFMVIYVGSDSATIETLNEILGPQFAGR